MPLSFRSFEWGRLLEHSFLEHFCLDQFSVFLGKCYMQESRTPRLLEHFWVPILGASFSNKLFVGTVRPSHFRNHYTHKIIIFKLFRSLQLQFSGPTGINFRYSYSFVSLT